MSSDKDSGPSPEWSASSVGGLGVRGHRLLVLVIFGHCNTGRCAAQGTEDAGVRLGTAF